MGFQSGSGYNWRDLKWITVEKLVKNKIGSGSTLFWGHSDWRNRGAITWPLALATLLQTLRCTKLYIRGEIRKKVIWPLATSEDTI